MSDGVGTNAVGRSGKGVGTEVVTCCGEVARIGEEGLIGVWCLCDGKVVWRLRRRCCAGLVYHDKIGGELVVDGCRGRG